MCGIKDSASLSRRSARDAVVTEGNPTELDLVAGTLCVSLYCKLKKIQLCISPTPDHNYERK